MYHDNEILFNCDNKNSNKPIEYDYPLMWNAFLYNIYM